MFDEFNELEYLTPIDEAYFGKTSGLKKCESLLEKVIEYCKGVYNGTYKGIINETKEVKELENLFAKEFNIGEFSLTFYTFDITTNIKSFSPNAVTLPSSIQFLKPSKDNKKITNTKNTYVGVNVDINLVVTFELNVEELMAIILHEIGHSLNASIFTFLSEIPNRKERLKLETLLLFNGATATFLPIGLGLMFRSKLIRGRDWLNKHINNFLNSHPDAAMFINQIMNITDQIIKIFNPFRELAEFITNPLSMLISYIEPSNLFGYQTERFSDSFATAYGYGVGIATFVHKLEIHHGSIIQDINSYIPAFAIGRDIAEISINIVGLLASPYPTNPSRIVNQLNKLKRDAKDPNLTPSVRKDLELNIKRLEEVIDTEVLNRKNYDTESTGVSPIKYLYNYIIIKVFNGKIDPRELLNIGNHYEL